MRVTINAPGTSAVNETFEALSGIKIVSLVFACIGALLGISYIEMTKRMAFCALIAGLLCGSFGPEAVAAWWGAPLRPALNNGIAVILGILGMFVLPGIFKLGAMLRDDPIGFVGNVWDLIRGIKKDAAAGKDGEPK